MRRKAVFWLMMFVGFFFAPVSGNSAEIQSVWRSQYGDISFFQQPDADGVIATYGPVSENGRLILQDSGPDSIRGLWVEYSSAQACQSNVLGSRHWGFYEFRFDTSETFGGRWGYCEGSLEHSWSGSLKRVFSGGGGGRSGTGIKSEGETVCWLKQSGDTNCGTWGLRAPTQ